MSSKPASKEIPILKRLDDAERLLARCAEPFKLKLKITSPTLRAKLPLVAETRALRACQNIETTASVLLECRDLGIDPRSDLDFFKLSMRALGATYPANLFEMLRQTPFIEAYDVTQFQVFRNVRFMEATSYSLAETMAFEWFEIYERTQEFNDELMRLATKDIWRKGQAIPMTLAPHHLREIYGNKQLVMADFKVIAPLYSGPDRPFGLVIASDSKIEKG